MKILIVKTSALGDIIHTFPVLQFIHEQFPEARVDWLAEKDNSELILAHPQVHTVHSTRTRQWRKGKKLRLLYPMIRRLRETGYDVVFDLQGNLKSAFFTRLARSPHKVGFGRKTVAEWPNLLTTNHRFDPPPGSNIRDDYVYLARSYFDLWGPFESKSVPLKTSADQQEEVKNLLHHPALIGGPLRLICPGAHWINKQLRKEQLLQHLMGLSGKFLFIWGSEEEKRVAEFLHARFKENSLVVDRMPLPQLHSLMTMVDQVIAMDSLPLHLAGLTDTPVRAFFGPTAAKKYMPPGEENTFFQGECPYGVTFEKRCPKLRKCKTGACLR